jgi:hypothetical protein
MASSLLDRVKRPPQSAETFIAAADAPPKDSPTISTTVPTPVSSSTETMTEAAPEIIPPATITKARPSQRARRSPDEDPRKHEVPRYTFNLRLNDYELELLRSLAEEQRESMQKIVKNGLIPYLESLRKKGNTSVDS